MTKKWISVLLAAVLLLAVFPEVPLKTNAVEVMSISQELVDFQIRREGFSQYPYWDNNHYTVGYGTTCPDDKYTYYKKYGITEAEALVLLYDSLAAFENAVNNYAKKWNLTLNQHQFDALVSFCFNCGTSWMADRNGYFNVAVRSGDMGSGLLYGMCLWSSSGGDYILIRRRLTEANMYLNGGYYDYPDSYGYVYLDGNGGTVEYPIHGYDGTLESPILTNFSSIPVGVDEAGNPFIYEFAGWYTEPVGGDRIEVLDGTLDNATVLYAQWRIPGGETVALSKGDVIEPLDVTVSKKVNVRSGPGSFYSKAETLAKGTVVTVTETYYYGSTLWGRIESGWIALNYTDYETVLANREAVDDSNWPKNGTVTGINVNVRSGAGKSYAVQYQLTVGDSVVVHEAYDDGSLVWGRLEDGNWICLSYVAFEETEDPVEAVTVTAVELLSGPVKTEYVQMQGILDMHGTLVKVTYSDGSIAAMSATRYMVDSFSNETLGPTTVVLSYEGFEFTFDVTIVMATVTFKNYDGTVLSQAQYEYGAEVTLPETPAREADEAGEYVFAGWDKTVVPVAGSITYTALFEIAPEIPEETVPDETVPEDTVPEETQPEDTVPEETVPGETEPAYISGDFDGSGAVDEDDAAYLLGYLLFPEWYPIEIPTDIDGNEVTDEDDAAYLLGYLLFPEWYPLG